MLKKLSVKFKEKFNLDDICVSVNGFVLIEFSSKKYIKEFWFDSKELFCKEMKLNLDEIDWRGF